MSGLAPGTTALWRHALKRDRILLSAWVGALTTMVAASAFATQGLYDVTAELAAAARVINTSPALVALYGPILNEDSLGEVAMSKLTVLYALFVMGMALVLVRRHTRTEEETGRAELIGATLVARQAPLDAALLHGAAASVLLGILAAGMDLAAGLEPAGSIAFGLSWLGIGLVGTGTAAVCCQLSASTRTCGGIAIAAFAAAYLLRAAGDIGPDALGWLSPLGWGTRLDAWGSTRWWVLGLYAGLAAALAVAARVLRGHRDLGGGLLADRSGPAHGALGSVPALFWRLTCAMTGWWILAALVFGALFGSITPHLGAVFDSPAGQAALEALGGTGQLEKVMLAALLVIMAAMLSAYSVQVVVAAGHEETDDRTPIVLAADGSRLRLFLTVATVALAGPLVLATAYGVGSAVGYGSQVGGVPDALVELVPAGWAYVPAMWVIAALSLLAWAWRPSLAWAGWALLAGFVTLGEIGPLLELPGWVIGLSPFDHVPNVPVSSVSWASEAGLTAVALLVVVAAWWRYARRDVG